MTELATLTKVEKTYRVVGVETKALNGVSITIKHGDVCAIAGPSGSGKTTLLNIIGCLDRASKGSVLFSGENVEKLSDSKLSQIRAKKIGFVFQFFNLIQSLDILQNVEYPLLVNKTPRKEARLAALSSLADVGLSAFIKHKPNQLSGGQQQRVAIARALVKRPDIVLADEPTGNLDTKNGEAVIDLMFEMANKYKTTLVFSSHDNSLFERCPHKYRIMDGEIVDENER